MPAIIKTFRLLRESAPETESIRMPRRARITGMQLVSGERFCVLYAEVAVDADTKAFDTNTHLRTFTIRGRGDAVPDGALVAFDQGIHVYEVKAP